MAEPGVPCRMAGRREDRHGTGGRSSGAGGDFLHQLSVPKAPRFRRGHSIPLAENVARVWLESGAGIRDLTAAPPPGGCGPCPSAILRRSTGPDPFGARRPSARLSPSARERIRRRLSVWAQRKAVRVRPFKSFSPLMLRRKVGIGFQGRRLSVWSHRVWGEIHQLFHTHLLPIAAAYPGVTPRSVRPPGRARLWVQGPR